jgi:hypothetical protein
MSKEYPGDLQRDALKHWRRFCACLEALPAVRAEHVWRTVSVEIAALRRARSNRPRHPDAGIFIRAASHVLPKAIFWEANPAQVSDFSGASRP